MREDLINKNKTYKEKPLEEKHEFDEYNNFEEIIHEDHFKIVKSIENILKNHYGEVKKIDISRNYSIRELIDIGLIDSLEELNIDKNNIDYNFIIDFKAYLDYKYYKVKNITNKHRKESRIHGDFVGIIAVESDNELEMPHIMELQTYYSGKKMRLLEVSKDLMDIGDLSEELLNLIPKEFGKFELESFAPYSNSIYFVNNEGHKCRISDHKLEGSNQYTYPLSYNIIINQKNNKEEGTSD